MLDWFGGGDDEAEVDHWELRYMPPDGGSWRRATHVEELEGDVGNLQHELEQQHIEETARAAGWRPGRYGLQGRRPDGTFTSRLWEFEIDGEVDDSNPRDEQLRRLERKLDRLEDGDGEAVDLETALEQMQYKVGIEALSSEEFMNRYGDQVAASVLGVDNGVDVDEIEEHGFAALAVDAYNNPERIETGSQRLGELVGAMVDGFEAGTDGESASAANESGDGTRWDPEINAGRDLDVSRPEARYRLRFPDQYSAEEIEEAHGLLPDEEVAEIEEKVEPETDKLTADADGDRGVAATATDGGEEQCQGYTQDGEQCKRRPEPGSDYCYQHRAEAADGSSPDAVAEQLHADGGEG